MSQLYEGGSYTCVAKNEAGTDKRDFTVTIVGKDLQLLFYTKKIKVVISFFFSSLTKRFKVKGMNFFFNMQIAEISALAKVT